MTPSLDDARNISGRPGRRFVRLTAVGITVGVAAAAIVGSTGASAAAAPKPTAQSVGRFLDGSVGGNPIQDLADVVDARATAAPTTSQRNPLEAKVLSALDVPLGSALQLPGGGALQLGAANQLADANADGSSLGASGAVANSGGASLGGDNSTYPANAQLNLSAAALGSLSIPGLSGITGVLPSTPTSNLAALGGITGSIGATNGIVQTAKGGKIVTPSSGIATLKLNIGSPALGALLTQLKSVLSTSTLNSLLAQLGSTSSASSALGPVTSVLNGLGLGAVTGGTTAAPAGASCQLTSTATNDFAVDAGGAITINASTATISIDVAKLITEVLGKDISDLDTSNFDLVDFLVENLPTILSQGLKSTITGITDNLSDQFTACATALTGNTALSGVLTTLTGILTSGQKQLLAALTPVTDQLTSASAAPLTQLASGLKQVIDIGLNVQSGPGIQKQETTYPFTSGLKATPDQATAVVDKQTLVRAIEIDVLPAAGGAGGTLPALPGLNSSSVRQLAGAPRAAAAAAGGGIAVLALGNAAAGPNTAVAPSSSALLSPSVTTPSGTTTDIPTGVPAGAAGSHGGGSPALPIVLVLIGLVLAGGGVTAYRSRGKFSH